MWLSLQEVENWQILNNPSYLLHGLQSYVNDDICITFKSKKRYIWSCSHIGIEDHLISNQLTMEWTTVRQNFFVRAWLFFAHCNWKYKIMYVTLLPNSSKVDITSLYLFKTVHRRVKPLYYFNGSQLAKLKRSIPLMLLPWNL